MSFIYLLCRKNEKGAFWAKGQRKEAGERARRGEGLPSRGRAAGSPQRGGLPWARRAPVGRRAPPAPQRAPQRAGPAAACHLRPPLRHWLRSATCRGAAPAASAGSRGAVTCGGAACPPAPMRRRSARAEPSAGRESRGGPGSGRPLLQKSAGTAVTSPISPDVFPRRLAELNIPQWALWGVSALTSTRF